MKRYLRQKDINESIDNYYWNISLLVPSNGKFDK